MNKYEMMFIVKATIDEAKVSEVAENLKSVITSMKGEITDSKDMGQKKLAYPIKKELTGFYFVVNFNADNETIAELDRKARIDENVIRHMIIKLDEE